MFSFAPGSASQPSGTQSNNTYVAFSNILGGLYVLRETPPADYVLRTICWTKSLNTPSSGSELSTYLSVPTDTDTLTWDLGYSRGAAWFQVEGGDVFAATTMESLVPDSTTPRVLVNIGSGGYPGVVFHGTDSPSPGFDFAPPTTNDGWDRISTTNWIVHDDGLTQLWDDPWDPYTVFWRRFGGPNVIDYDGTAGNLSQPTSRATPYLVKGTMSTSGNWIVPDGEKLTFLIDGNLTINGTITALGTGVATFITKGDITVASTVGVAPTSSTPVLEGIYIAGGSFKTSPSVAGVERFVGKGAFFANSFTLDRTLGDAINTTTAPELFLYDPKLITHQPERMKEFPYTWEEVAP